MTTSKCFQGRILTTLLVFPVFTLSVNGAMISYGTHEIGKPSKSRHVGSKATPLADGTQIANISNGNPRPVSYGYGSFTKGSRDPVPSMPALGTAYAGRRELKESKLLGIAYAGRKNAKENKWFGTAYARRKDLEVKKLKSLTSADNTLGSYVHSNAKYGNRNHQVLYGGNDVDFVKPPSFLGNQVTDLSQICSLAADHPKQVPDAGTTVASLGIGLIGLGFLRRFLSSKGA